MLIDTHSHIHVKAFDADRAQVIERARQAGVGILIEVGFNPGGWNACARLAQEHENIYWAAGIHPHEANLATEENLGNIEKFARGPYGKKLVAIGETGIDLFKNRQPKDVQIRALIAQFKLAKKLNLPVIIHCRDAYKEVLDLAQREKIQKAVFHCFAGTLEEARLCWDRGFMTSFTGICTYPNAQSVRDIIEAAPVDKIMIETDCPYLAPQSKRGKRNEPAFTAEIFEKVCEIKKMEQSELKATLDKYTRSFFNLPD